MCKKTDTEVPIAFHRMRHKTLTQTLILFFVICISMIAWAFLYQYFGIKSGVLFLVGGFIILLVAFLYASKIEKQVVCPSCGKSLSDSQGWDVYVKKCPHCGASYERET